MKKEVENAGQQLNARFAAIESHKVVEEVDNVVWMFIFYHSTFGAYGKGYENV